MVPAVAVLTSELDPSLLEYLSGNHVDSVMLGGGTIGPHRSSLRLDYEKGAVAAVRCLYNLGHREFVMIAGPQNRKSHIAYKTAIESAARALDCRLRIVVGRNTIDSGSQAVREFITDSAVPTAILCSNDLTAVGAVRTLTGSGLRVPEHVSVVGLDDIPLAELMSPSLTTVHIPRHELGQLAFSILHRMLSGEIPAGIEATLDSHLIVRGSTGASRKVKFFKRR